MFSEGLLWIMWVFGKVFVMVWCRYLVWDMLLVRNIVFGLLLMLLWIWVSSFWICFR